MSLHELLNLTLQNYNHKLNEGLNLDSDLWAIARFYEMENANYYQVYIVHKNTEITLISRAFPTKLNHIHLYHSGKQEVIDKIEDSLTQFESELRDFLSSPEVLLSLTKRREELLPKTAEAAA